MTVPAESFVDVCLSQSGDKYVFGAEASPLDPNPSAFDCSELVEWASKRAGISPTVPDGAYNQWKHCQALTVSHALTVRGALLFVGDGTGSGRNAIHHVAVSLGDGTTIEARGSKWGVGTWGASGRFDFAGAIPGVDYSGKPKPRPVNQGGGVQLRPGSKGEAVRFLQAMLNIVTPYAKLGNQKRIAEDGDFGPATTARVKEFEVWCNKMGRLVHAKDPALTEDGIPTATTLARLGYWVNAALKK